MKPADKRDPVPDLMKGIAVLAMVQVHLMELFAREEIFTGLAGKISLFIGGPFAAPVFMTVMGYFIAKSSRTNTEKIKRGILIILLGLMLNIGLNLHLLVKIYNGTFELNPLEYIFGADILFLAGLSIIFTAIMERLFREKVLFLLIIAISIPILTPYLPDLPVSFKYIQAFFYGSYSWSYFPAFPWVSYSLLGYILNRLITRYPGAWKRLMNKMAPIMLMISLVLIIFFLPAWKIITDLPSYYHHQIFLFTWIVAFLALFTWSAYKAEAKAGHSMVMKYVKWLGKNVTAVYVFQWLIIGNIATAIYKTQSLIALSIWFIGIMAMVSGLSYVYERLRA